MMGMSLTRKLKVMKDKLKIAVIGLLMGAAEVVPGVSGGTIAFITGIYERLLLALKQFTPRLLLGLRDPGIAALWRQVDANFLLLLFGGMGVAILAFATGISYLMQHQAVSLWAFFFGLVIASSWVMAQQVSGFSARLLFFATMGTATGILLTGFAPIDLPPTPLYIFLGGAIAVCAWILPGISGSFILLILGLYGVIIDAIKQLDVVTLALLGSGCAVGLVSFAQVLSRLFARARDETLAVLTGFMLGSLAKLWPWKQTLAYQLGSDGHQIPLVQEPIWPATYHTLTGLEPQIGLAVLAMLLGLVVVVGLDRFAMAETVSTRVKK